MKYPFKYPEVYAELARQGKQKKDLALYIGITTAGLRYKQSVGDFENEEMKKTADFLGKSTEYLFSIENLTYSG